MGCGSSKSKAFSELQLQKSGSRYVQQEVQAQATQTETRTQEGAAVVSSGNTRAFTGCEPLHTVRTDYACSRGASSELPESLGHTTPLSCEAAPLYRSFSNQLSASSAETSLLASLGIESAACHLANESAADGQTSPEAGAGSQTMTSSLKSNNSSISSGVPPDYRVLHSSDGSLDSVTSAPLPANEKHRQNAVDKLSAVLYGLQQDPQLEGITQLVSHIFHVAICFITIFDKDLAVVLSAYGMSKPRFFARQKTMGAWTIVPDAKQLLVVEDMLDDARFRHHRSARWKKPLRFVAGAPLVTSSGHKIGALCMMDFRPRHLQGGMYVLFANLAEIVQVELEREVYLDGHDVLKPRLPAEGPLPLSIPMRHLSHMSAATPPLSSRSSEAPPDADEPGTMNSGNSGVAHAFAAGEGKLSNLGLPSGREASMEAKLAGLGPDAQDVDLSELAEAWWISAQNGSPADPSPTLRDQLRERVKAYVSELTPPCDPAQMLAAVQSSSAGSVVPQSSTDTAIDASTTGSLTGAPASPRFNTKMIPQARTGRNHRNSMMLLGTSTFDVELPDLAEGVMLCDAQQPDWRVVVASTRCLQVLGLTRSQGTGRKLWDMLEVPGEDAEASLVRMEQMLNTEPFVARMIVCRRPSSGFAAHSFKLRVSSACVSHVDHRIAVAGIPAYAAQRPEPEPRYFFVFLSLENTQELTPNRRLSMARHASLPDEPSEADDKIFHNIRLGALLGKGAYGKVYHGIWKNQDVAVKIMEAFHNTQEGAAAEVNEIKVAQSLQHPHIVQTLHCATRTVQNVFEGAAGIFDRALESPACRTWLVETWIILELCSKGTLQDACERGWFRPSGCAAKFDLVMVLQTALEVADAMCYLHAGNVIHGDLTHGNILLSSSTLDARKFTAKVADFGLSRFMTASAVDTATFGTVTHMPPELLMEGKLTKAADVFAFGVLLWSMCMGRLPWQGFQRTQIMFKVTIKREQLKLTGDVPERCKELVNCCLDRNRHARPSFEELKQQLQAYLHDVQRAAQPAPAAHAPL